MRKKSDGPGEMVSAFVDEVRGFGFPLVPGELERINEFRARNGRPPLAASPGLDFFKIRQKPGGILGV